MWARQPRTRLRGRRRKAERGNGVVEREQEDTEQGDIGQDDVGQDNIGQDNIGQENIGTDNVGTDTGPAMRPGQTRTCIVTRVPGTPDTLIRFVRDPDGIVVPDLRRKLPGRGVWVTAEAQTIARAVAKKLFARGFRAPANVPPDLVEQVAEHLRRECLQALSMANKAGAVTTGFVKVEALCETGKVAALLHASDSAPDGARKLAQALRRGHGDATTMDSRGSIPIVRFFAGEELDLALGRSHVIHAALVAGSGSDGFVARWHKLARFQSLAALEPNDDGKIDEIKPD